MASWIAISKKTGKAVMETFNPKTAKAVNRKAYNVRSSHAYLVSLNKQVKKGRAI